MPSFYLQKRHSHGCGLHPSGSLGTRRPVTTERVSTGPAGLTAKVSPRAKPRSHAANLRPYGRSSVSLTTQVVKRNHWYMSWDWVAPTATAAVGIAGIAATWLTARASRIDQRNMILVQYKQAEEAALRETRRKAYATFSASLYEMITVASFALDPDFGKAEESLHSVTRSLAEVEILGSDAVRQSARQAAVKVIKYQAIALQNEDGSGIPDTELQVDSNEALYLLERLMASDLGISVTASMEEIKKNMETLKQAAEVMGHRRRQRKAMPDSAGQRANHKTADILIDFYGV